MKPTPAWASSNSCAEPIFLFGPRALRSGHTLGDALAAGDLSAYQVAHRCLARHAAISANALLLLGRFRRRRTCIFADSGRNCSALGECLGPQNHAMPSRQCPFLTFSKWARLSVDGRRLGGRSSRDISSARREVAHEHHAAPDSQTADRFAADRDWWRRAKVPASHGNCASSSKLASWAFCEGGIGISAAGGAGV